ncbi:transmembrane protein 268-like isoform X1 [Amphibalanus amphitrite]|uniref:transmembrane protein 268-like isoform X1 n=1 Tax=Amphibalanus amphitrite TaxID=1232801 RepID=UPI001C90E98B|nr:transmembrane protein 268-like isoform X1 [Amphibalanus amphitrite]XP_043220291.1 transmembrane protein 268-like isoform X1 [Amphibalanus amphitrite]
MSEDKLPESEQKKWVQFDEEAGGTSERPENGNAPATIDVQNETLEAAEDPSNIRVNVPSPAPVDRSPARNGVRPEPALTTSAALQDVSLADQPAPAAGGVRQGFENGDVIVTLLPLNSTLPWITPAQFRPELVPEELMAQGLTLTVEEYVQGMELLVNDVRFNAYNICYKRILVGWILMGFVVLIAILFAVNPGIELFGCGVIWLIVNAVAIFVCMWIKIKLNRELERCVALVNRVFSKHNILVGVDDRGRLSCHKVNLCFIYFKTHDCVKTLQEVVDREDAAGSAADDAEARARSLRVQQRMDIDDSDIIITGSQTTRLSRKQERARRLLLRYSQRWAKDYLRKRLDWTVDMNERLEAGAGACSPRHLATARCPCQYIEDHLSWKPQKRPKDRCCGFQLPESCAALLC